MVLTSCKYAEIYNLQDRYLCEAHVTRTEEDKATLIIGKEDSELLPPKVRVVFQDASKGLVTCLCELSDFKESIHPSNRNRVTVHCAILEKISELQRRNDLKVSLNFSFYIAQVNGDKLKEPIQAVVRNLSAGGMFFTAKYPLSVGSIIKFDIILNPNKGPLHLQAEILRIQDNLSLQRIIGRLAEEKEILGFGCRFVRLHSWDEARIRNYVFQKDLIRRRRISGVF